MNKKSVIEIRCLFLIGWFVKYELMRHRAAEKAPFCLPLSVKIFATFIALVQIPIIVLPKRCNGLLHYSTTKGYDDHFCAKICF